MKHICHLAIILALAALPAQAQGKATAPESVVFKTDFEKCQVYSYEGKITSTVQLADQDPQESVVDLQWDYVIMKADARGFVLCSRITRLKTSDGRIDYPAGKTPPALRALLGLIPCLKYSFTPRWKLRKVSGFGQIANALLKNLPPEGRKLIGQVVDTVLGPLATQAQARSLDQGFGRLFRKRGARVGDKWRSEERMLFWRVSQQYEVVRIGKRGKRPVVHLQMSQTTSGAGPLASLGFSGQRMKGKMHLLTNGMLARMQFTQDQETFGTKVSSKGVFTLVKIGQVQKAKPSG